MGKLSAYIRLFRIEHALLLAVAVLLAELIASAALKVPLPALPLIICSLLVPVFIEMGSFALNDYFDVKTDKANKRKDRPLASGEIAPKSALILAAVCYILGIAAALPFATVYVPCPLQVYPPCPAQHIFPSPAFAIVLLFAFLSLAYNFKLKELPLVGNIYIAASMAIPFIFGNFVISQTLYSPLLAMAAVAFFAGLGREIMKSTEDMEGDVKHRNAKTLPVIIGEKNALRASALCYILLIPLAFLPFALGFPPNLPSLGLVALTAISFAFMARELIQKKPDLVALRKTSLLALGVGLLGYAAALLSI